jgi:tetratricopeptide (TPR) repeat protein
LISTNSIHFAKLLVVALLGFSLLTGCTSTGGKQQDDEAGLSQWQKANKRLKRGKYDKALVLLDEILVTQPELAEAHINRGIALAGLRRNAEALVALETGLNLHPQNPRTVASVYNQAGIIYRSNQQLDAARKAYEKAVNQDPSFDLPHFNLALLYEKALGQPEKALQHYAAYQALQDTPDPAVQVWVRMLEKDNGLSTAELIE